MQLDIILREQSYKVRVWKYQRYRRNVDPSSISCKYKSKSPPTLTCTKLSIGKTEQTKPKIEGSIIGEEQSKLSALETREINAKSAKPLRFTKNQAPLTAKDNQKREKLILQMQISSFNRATEEEIHAKKILFSSSLLFFLLRYEKTTKLSSYSREYSCECECFFLWTLEEGDDDVTNSLVVVHRQFYD